MTPDNIDTGHLRARIERYHELAEKPGRLTDLESAEMRQVKAMLIVEAPALLATVEAQRKEIEGLRAENERMRKEMYEVWKYALGCDCVPSSAYTCRACAIDYPAADVVGELRRARDDSDELWEIVAGVIPDWNEREDEGETKQDRLKSIVAERDALKAEVERLNSGWQSCLEALEIAKGAMLRSGAARDSYFAEAATLRAKLSASETEVERLRAAASAAFDWSPDRDGSPDIVAALQRYRAALRGEEASRE